jgi:hypothetical protein
LLVALVIVSIGFVALFAYVMFGQPHDRAPAAGHTPSSAQPQGALEAELDKKRRELDEQRALVQELRGAVKQTKRKLFDQKEADKGGQDLVKARAEVERSASAQLETVRGELAAALSELGKLRQDQDPRRRSATPAPPVAPKAEEATAEKDKPVRRFRELNDADRERMERLEHQANKDRGKASELEREVKRLKGRNETQHRVYVVTKGELDLLKDKFKALEKRLNRTLLERDLVRRAIKDLERSTGTPAPRTELTAEEIAASDQKVEERLKAESSEAERRAAIAASPPEDPGSPEAAPTADPSPPAAEPARAPDPAPAQPSGAGMKM